MKIFLGCLKFVALLLLIVLGIAFIAAFLLATVIAVLIITKPRVHVD